MCTPIQVTENDHLKYTGDYGRTQSGDGEYSFLGSDLFEGNG